MYEIRRGLKRRDCITRRTDRGEKNISLSKKASAPKLERRRGSLKLSLSLSHSSFSGEESPLTRGNWVGSGSVTEFLINLGAARWAVGKREGGKRCWLERCLPRAQLCVCPKYARGRRCLQTPAWNILQGKLYTSYLLRAC